MPTLEDIKTWRGRDVVDSDGEKIGTLEDVYLDRASGEPEWAAIKTGRFGTKVSFAPLRDASATGDEVRIPYSKDQVNDAPKIESDGDLSPEEEQRLYTHYGRSDYGDWEGGTGDAQASIGRDERVSTQQPDARSRPARTGTGTGYEDETTTTAGGTGTQGESERAEGESEQIRRGAEAGDEREPTTTESGKFREDVPGRETDEAMTRSEEELRVGTTRRETGRARLHKYVETETVQQTVPVEREEVRVEREPITDENIEQAMRGPDISEAEHEVTLHAEEPVVEKRTVPKERVRLDKETVSDEETVNQEVRKEQIEGDAEAEGR